MRTKIGKYEIEGGGSCPEQYDVYLDGKEIGYLRLRHGRFRAETPFGGQVVYVAEPEGDGCFKDHERDQHLAAAIKAIDDYLAAKSSNDRDQRTRSGRRKRPDVGNTTKT